MTTFIGKVVDVELRRAETELIGTHTAPLSVLTVLDSSGLPESGTVIVNFEKLAYTSKTDTDDLDATALYDTLILATPTVNDYAPGAPVVVDPQRPYKVALVVEDGQDTAVECRIRHHWQDALVVGPRPIGGDEDVEVTVYDEDELVITDVIGAALGRDGSYTANGTLPLSAATDWDDAATMEVAKQLVRASGLDGVDLGAIIATIMSNDGRAVTFNGPQGLVSMTNPDGSEAGTLGSVANYIQAWIDAVTFVAQGTADFRGDTRFNPGTKTSWMNDYPAPQVGPRCEVGWDTADSIWPGLSQLAGGDISMTEDSGHLYVTQLVNITGKKHAAPVIELRKMAPTGGEMTVEWQTSLPGVGLGAGMTRIGSSTFLLAVIDTGVYKVCEYDSTDGTSLGSWAPTNPGSTSPPCLGRDYVNDLLLVGWRSTAGHTYIIQTYDLTGTLTDTFTTATLPGGALVAPTGVSFGEYDFGVERFVVVAGFDTSTWLFDPTDGSEDVANEWLLASLYLYGQTGIANVPADICWDATAGVFRELAVGRDQNLYTYTDARLGTGFDTYPAEIVQTFSDGTHETEMSAPTSVTMLQRARIKANGGDLPPWADRRVVYYGEGTGLPRTSFWRQGTPAHGDREWILTPHALTGTNPPVSSTYPPPDPAEAWGITKLFDGAYAHASTIPARLDAIESSGGSGVTDDTWTVDELTGDIYIEGAL